MSDGDLTKPIDISGATLEDAIEAGLKRLGLNRNDVIIEIIEEGSRGMLGIGAREAKVRLTPLRAPVQAAKPAAPAQSPAPAARPAASAAPAAPAPVQEQQTFDDEEPEIARNVLSELLTHMGIPSSIHVYRAEFAEEDDGEPPWVLDIQGNDLGVLIGRHGETLDALQYVARLIVSRELQGRANIVLDVEGYKARREVALKKLAQTMAAQARQMNRVMTLEPMPPNERRIIHITLRDDQTVTTESVGTGDQRRVTIIPRQS
jgi:spoIIIJ-associated protein